MIVKNIWSKVKIYENGCKELQRNGGSEFSSYEIEFRNRVMQNDVTLPVTNSTL